ncbi:MAG: 5-(carboxyamino)imidazole ribonucleotide synthase [Woeseiaceae bacterium]|nr:5-(carboxyamino)imidazole ribonucleotide synthase [Woeseiaceae bacterium]
MTRVGIIGAGQLGQMLGQAGAGLDITCTFLDPSPSPPAAATGPVIRAAYDDATALRELAAQSDVLTYEFENVPVATLSGVADVVPVLPPPAALAAAQDRLSEKRLFEELDIPIADYRAIDNEADVHEAIAALGLPLVLKTRRFGYDGKGQVVLRSASQVSAALAGLPDAPLIAEQWIAFDREVSAIGVRSADGATRFYPLTENEHRDGILRISRAPATSPGLAERANACVGALLARLDYVGVLALEFFVVGETLLANEFAPRVHNSGHWTIEGAATSQFENHLRAVTGLPLGSTESSGHAAMVNLIGSLPPASRRAARSAASSCTTTARQHAAGASSATSRFARRQRQAATNACGTWLPCCPRETPRTAGRDLAHGSCRVWAIKSGYTHAFRITRSPNFRLLRFHKHSRCPTWNISNSMQQPFRPTPAILIRVAPEQATRAREG